MMDLKLGIVTSVRNTNKGCFINILGIDGTFYSDIEVLNTLGLNEVPVPSDIPTRDPNLINEFEKLFSEEQIDNLLSVNSVLNSQIRTTVLFGVVRSTSENDSRTVIPIRFYKNYSMASEGSPPIFTKVPKPGEISIQASGDYVEQLPGGFLYLNKVGDVSLHTGLSTCSIDMNNLLGASTIACNKLTLTCSCFTLTIEQGSFILSRKKFISPGVYGPTNDVVLSIDQTGNMRIDVSPAGTATGSIIIDNMGNIELESKTSIKIKSSGTLDIDSTGTTNISSTGTMNIESTTDINIKGLTVKLNDGSENVIKGQSFMQLFNSHQHTYMLEGVPTLTTAPTSVMTPSMLTTKTFVG